MKALVVEDHRLLRYSMVGALRGWQIEVVGDAHDPVTALGQADALRPDIAVVDIRLPPTFTDEGVQIAEAVRRRHPEIGILLLSSHVGAAHAERLLSMEDSARSVGYLLKERVTDLAHLVDAMRRIVAGEVVIDPFVLDALLARRRANDPVQSLTPHELRVLAMVADGLSNSGIAQELGCNVSSVEKHLSAINTKLRLPPPGDPQRPLVNVRVRAALLYLRQQGGGEMPAPPRPVT